MINNCNSYSVINKNLTNKIKIIPLLSYTLQYYRKGSNCRAFINNSTLFIYYSAVKGRSLYYN